MYKDAIAGLISACNEAARAGIAPEEIQSRVLPDAVNGLMKVISAQEFLEWVREDRDYSFYYYEAQQSGACAKPREAAAMILEAIALDEIDQIYKTSD